MLLPLPLLSLALLYWAWLQLCWWALQPLAPTCGDHPAAAAAATSPETSAAGYLHLQQCQHLLLLVLLPQRLSWLHWVRVVAVPLMASCCGHGQLWEDAWQPQPWLHERNRAGKQSGGTSQTYNLQCLLHAGGVLEHSCGLPLSVLHVKAKSGQRSGCRVSAHTIVSTRFCR